LDVLRKSDKIETSQDECLVGGRDIYSARGTWASQCSSRNLLPLHHDGARYDDIFVWYRT